MCVMAHHERSLPILVMIESIGGKGRQSSYDAKSECAQGPTHPFAVTCRETREVIMA